MSALQTRHGGKFTSSFSSWGTFMFQWLQVNLLNVETYTLTCNPSDESTNSQSRFTKPKYTKPKYSSGEMGLDIPLRMLFPILLQWLSRYRWHLHQFSFSRAWKNYTKQVTTAPWSLLTSWLTVTGFVRWLIMAWGPSAKATYIERKHSRLYQVLLARVFLLFWSKVAESCI